MLGKNLMISDSVLHFFPHLCMIVLWNSMIVSVNGDVLILLALGDGVCLLLESFSRYT